MADPVGLTASILGIAGAGAKLAQELIALAEAIATAPKRIERLASDISVTCAVLAQLTDLMLPKADVKGNLVCIFNAQGLQDASITVKYCDNIFTEVRAELNKSSKELAARPRQNQQGPLHLTAAQRAKWPFLQPRMDAMRRDLREAKDTLLLMLTVATLSHAERVALGGEGTPIDPQARQKLTSTVVRLSTKRKPQDTMGMGNQDPKKQDTVDLDKKELGRQSTSDSVASEIPAQGVHSNKKVHRFSSMFSIIGHKSPKFTPKETSRGLDMGPPPFLSKVQDLPGLDTDKDEASNVDMSVFPQTDSHTENWDESVFQYQTHDPEDINSAKSIHRAIGLLREGSHGYKQTHSNAHKVAGLKSLNLPHAQVGSRKVIESEDLDMLAEADHLESEDTVPVIAMRMQRAPSGNRAHRQNRDKGLSEPTCGPSMEASDALPVAGRTAGDARPRERELIAFASTAKELTSGQLFYDIQKLPIPLAEIKLRLEARLAEIPSVFDMLQSLNSPQRKVVLEHVTDANMELLSIEKLAPVKRTTVYGDIEIEFLLWIGRAKPLRSVWRTGPTRGAASMVRGAPFPRRRASLSTLDRDVHAVEAESIAEDENELQSREMEPAWLGGHDINRMARYAQTTPRHQDPTRPLQNVEIGPSPQITGQRPKFQQTVSVTPYSYSPGEIILDAEAEEMAAFEADMRVRMEKDGFSKQHIQDLIDLRTVKTAEKDLSTTERPSQPRSSFGDKRRLLPPLNAGPLTSHPVHEFTPRPPTARQDLHGEFPGANDAEPNQGPRPEPAQTKTEAAESADKPKEETAAGSGPGNIKRATSRLSLSRVLTFSRRSNKDARPSVPTRRLEKKNAAAAAAFHPARMTLEGKDDDGRTRGGETQMPGTVHYREAIELPADSDSKNVETDSTVTQGGVGAQVDDTVVRELMAKWTTINEGAD